MGNCRSSQTILDATSPYARVVLDKEMPVTSLGNTFYDAYFSKDGSKIQLRLNGKVVKEATFERSVPRDKLRKSEVVMERCYSDPADQSDPTYRCRIEISKKEWKRPFDRDGIYDDVESFKMYTSDENTKRIRSILFGNGELKQRNDASNYDYTLKVQHSKIQNINAYFYLEKKMFELRADEDQNTKAGYFLRRALPRRSCKDRDNQRRMIFNLNCEVFERNAITNIAFYSDFCSILLQGERMQGINFAKTDENMNILREIKNAWTIGIQNYGQTVPGEPVDERQQNPIRARTNACPRSALSRTDSASGSPTFSHQVISLD